MFVASTSVSGISVMVVAVFVACVVEMVEALTIVVAVGHTSGWRPAIRGVAAALGALGLLVAGFGPALVQIPINTLRLIVGGVLLIFGLQWLRKAILRSTGLKAKHPDVVGMSSSNHDGVPTGLGLSPLGTLHQQAFGAPEALDPLSC